MRNIKLSHDLRAPITGVYHVIDYAPTPKVKPNPEALKQLSKTRRSKSGIEQSEHSRHRQNFITGMDVHRISPHEQKLRNEYNEEWHERARDNA